MLFAMDMTGANAAQADRHHWDYLASSVEGQEFASALLHGCADNAEAIDRTIRQVSEHWRLERMPRVDRNVLRLATYELMFLHDVPRRVTLNEAVELAKRYGGEGSPGFVNGVLDRIAADVGKS